MRDVKKKLLHWQQKSIAAEAKANTLKTELGTVKRQLQYHKVKECYWQQRCILAEAKVNSILAELQTIF